MEGSGDGASGAGAKASKAPAEERPLTRYVVFTVIEEGGVDALGEVLRRDGEVEAASKDIADREWTARLERESEDKLGELVEFRCIPERGIDPVYGVQLKQVTQAERSRR